MANLNEKECAHCGAVFSLVYTDKQGYKSLLNTTYCSKSCASKSHLKTNKGCIIPDVGKENLSQKAIDYVSARGEYCTSQEICKGVGHSSKTFSKHKLSFTEINREAGQVKPKSAFENKVGKTLSDKFDNVEREKKFDGLVGATGHSLRVDFYIPEINTVVEADGSQHSDPKHPWKEHKNGTVADYDKIKDEYFKKESIQLVRIPYKKNLKESDVLSRLS